MIYDKAFGYYKYDKKDKVDLNSIYDLASVTKISATTMVLMKLYQDSLLILPKLFPIICRKRKGSAIANIKSHRSAYASGRTGGMDSVLQENTEYRRNHQSRLLQSGEN